MNNCKDCNTNSSTTYSRCPEVVSTNCTFYQGNALQCANDETFTVCKGENMSSVQETLFNKICSLSGQIDVKEIKFPCSLQEAWRDEDPTLFNLLTYFANLACIQNGQIIQLGEDIANINPAVEICLACCGDDCGSTKLLLSDALNKIVTCLCNTKAEVASLTEQVGILQTSYNAVLSKLASLEAFQTSQTTLNISLQTRLSTVETKVECNPCG